MTVLSGKRALVTAGANGIGRVIARKLIEAGARVWVCDIDAAAVEAFSEEFPAADALVCDVADATSVTNTLEKVESAAGGPIDILVNNAGIAGPTANVEDVDADDWRHTIDVNLTSQFLVIKNLVRGMKSQRSGVIVNMSSAAGRLGMPMRTPYVAAKWAVIGLTQSLAMELGAYGIRVNAILPGSVRGPRMDRVIKARAEASGRTISEVEAEEVASISLGRMIDADEIADMVVYLSSESGRSVSGQSIGICGNTEVLR